MKIKRVVLRKLLAGLLLFGLLLPAVSCTEETKETEPSSGDFVAGNPDWENTYYSTRMIALPKHSYCVYGFGNDNGPSFITTDRYMNDAGTVEYEYTLFNCDYEGNTLSTFSLEDSSDFEMTDVCSLDNERFIVVGSGEQEYRIYDYSGNIISEVVGNATGERHVSKTSEGFVILYYCDNYVRISWYDHEEKCTNEITKIQQLNDADWIGLWSVFEQNGKYYAYGSCMLNSNSSMDVYFAIDLENESFEQLFRPWDVCNGLYPPESRLNGDYHNIYCGGPYNAEHLVEIDVEQQKAEILADTSNMLVCPPTYGGESYTPYKVLDKTHFFIDYTYPGENLDITEIALIVPDDNVNLAERTPIVIQGAGISTDMTLKNAAYYYNVSQNDFFIEFDDLASSYAFSTPESMNTTKLQLMAQYNNGNVPDIFYGDFFDYDYFGEHDMVIDLRSYLGNDPVYDRMTRDDGKIYQVYAGYTLTGYMGKSEVYGNDVSLASLPEIPDGQRRFGNAFAPDLVYQFIGNDLCSLYRNGDLTYDNVLLAVRTAIENGDEPDYQYTNYEPPVPADVGAGRSSLFSGGISIPDSYYDIARSFHSDPVFVGYPSINGSVHMITPKCLMAVSASAEHADVCCDFIQSLMSIDVQRRIGNLGIIPVNNDVLAEIVEFVKNPDGASDEQKMLYSNLVVYDRSNEMVSPRQVSMSADLADSYLAQINAADRVQIYDWGLWNITVDEVTAYYS